MNLLIACRDAQADCSFFVYTLRGLRGVSADAAEQVAQFLVVALPNGCSVDCEATSELASRGWLLESCCAHIHEASA